MKVLVIDDEHSIRHTLRRLLEAHGFEVVTANDGRHGMALFRSERPNLVITDIIMPEQEGIETIMLLRQERPEVGVIAISGGARTRNLDYLKMAGSLGADDVIQKPFEAEELLSRLDRLRAASIAGTTG